MVILQSLGFIGIGGTLGTLITVIVGHFLEKSKIQEQRVFDLKTTNYLEISSYFNRQSIVIIKNIFEGHNDTSDFNKDKLFERAMDYVHEMNMKLSKVKLISSPNIQILIDDLSRTLLDFSSHVINESERLQNGKKAKKTLDDELDKINELQINIVKNMRKEIGIN